MSYCTVLSKTVNKPTSNMQCVIFTDYSRRCHQRYQCTMLSEKNCDKCKLNATVKISGVNKKFYQMCWRNHGSEETQQAFSNSFVYTQTHKHNIIPSHFTSDVVASCLIPYKKNARSRISF